MARAIQCPNGRLSRKLLIIRSNFSSSIVVCCTCVCVFDLGLKIVARMYSSSVLKNVGMLFPPIVNTLLLNSIGLSEGSLISIVLESLPRRVVTFLNVSLVI